MSNREQISYVTTDFEVARRIADSFNALTGSASTTQRNHKLFVISATPTEKSSWELLKRIADNNVPTNSSTIQVS